MEKSPRSENNLEFTSVFDKVDETLDNYIKSLQEDVGKAQAQKEEILASVSEEEREDLEELMDLAVSIENLSPAEAREEAIKRNKQQMMEKLKRKKGKK